MQDFEKRRKHRREARPPENAQRTSRQSEISKLHIFELASLKLTPDEHRFDPAVQETSYSPSDMTSENNSNRPPSPTPELSDITDDTGDYIVRENVPSLDNMTIAVHQPSSPSKDDFHYGGFVESPDTTGVPVQSSPFGMVSSSV